MKFEEFERRAAEEWERIPEEYRAGVDGVVVERKAVPHPSLPDVYTLGECLTESYPSDWEGPDTTRSMVVLYYGSFYRLSRLDEAFDWEGELWETLTHELQHHLESLAAEDALVDMDYAADHNYKRYQGEEFDPYFYRHGLPTDGWQRVEDEWFLEVPEPVPGGAVHFEWRGATYRIAPPPQTADVLLLDVVDGIADPPGALHIAIVRRRTWRDTLRDVFARRAPTVAEHEVTAFVGE